MKPSEFIVQKLSDLKKTQAVILDGSLEDKIFRLILNKKFRKYSVTPEYKEHILNVVKTSVSRNEPIKFTWVFGGYKLWRLKETPEVDWAELFSFIYFVNWLKPICKIYKPGVWFDFYSDDVILEIMDNVPKKDTEQYVESFRNLLEFLKSYLSENLKFSLNRVGDQYESYDDFRKELEECIEKVKEGYGGLPKLTPEQMALAELNVKLKPGQDDDPKWKEKVFLIHDGYSRISKRRPYYRNPEKIMVVNTPIKDSLAVGTTKTSVVKFWVGAGALKRLDESYIEYIFSPKQLITNKFEVEPISIAGLKGKNFDRIRILR